MDSFITTGKKYHKFRDCQWIENIPEDKIMYLDVNDILDQNPCMGCTKRFDLVSNSIDPDKAKEIVSNKN
ncbi:MAG: hypothetical protein CBC54_005465 [Rhizobiales bacterium TMED94]|nr:MAG: hypothetical protein CBC54_005465 [Rhizobiales bacterium TMED94]|tara:strand:+ start:422 stop:631 length:210 start_codon:yes stop_codon:yes gene_type:complete